MNAGEAVRAAVIAGLRADPALSGVEGLSGRYPRGSLPRIDIDTAQVSDWGTKDARGREIRTAVGLRVARGQAARLPAMIDAAENAGCALAGDIGGWRVASAVLIRSRAVDESDAVRAGLVEHRIRILENGD